MSDIDNDDIRRLDGGLLLIFRELLRRRRVTDTADALGLSQSAVSHALARLRDIYGDELFTRRPHGLEPTRRALELGPRIEALIELAGATLRAEAGFDPASTDRRFIFSAPEFVLALVGARLLQRLRAEAPNASFVALDQAREVAFEALRRREIDFALGRFGAHRVGFAIEALYEDRYCVVARKGHPAFKSGRISQKAFMETGHVFSGSPSEGDPDDADAIGEIKWQAVAPRWLPALAMASQSDAIVTCPRRLAERLAPVFGLQILKAPFVSNRIAVSVARRAGETDAAVSWFLDAVRWAARGS
jgi:DNA-binding transcriptional LysR family regulator